MTPISSGDSRKPTRSSQLMTARPEPRRQAGELVRGVVDGRDERRDAEPGQREADERRGHRREGQRQAHAQRDQHPADLHDEALPEPVDDAVAGEPADRHGALQGDEAQPRDRGTGRQFAAQVEGAPRRAGVLDDRPAGREDAEGHQRPQCAVRRPLPFPAGAAVRRRARSRRAAPGSARGRPRRGRGASRRWMTRARSPKTTAVPARCQTSGTPRPAAAEPSSPPLTAPMLQMPWNALRIERP